jgi:hypothetical protein
LIRFSMRLGLGRVVGYSTSALGQDMSQTGRITVAP